MANKNTQIKELEKALLYDKKSTFKTATADEIAAAESFCEDYKAFLDGGKTERAVTAQVITRAEGAGFTAYAPDKKYTAGDKIYVNNRGKAVTLAVIGSEPLDNGVSIIASHIDSPRIDLKANPLFEDGGMAFFKTHYYGGLKKYQWPAVPLALHGVVVKADGSVVQVCIGEDDSDPVFTVTDLLPHLSDAQYKRPSKELIKGEELNILVGSKPYVIDDSNEKEQGSVKLAIMKLLHDKYGIVERDFASAELSAVPAAKARDVGFDRSLVGGYGQDDRVCAYTSMAALLDMQGIPNKTAVCVLADKEEVGSYGNTGLGSDYLAHFLEDLAAAQGVNVRRMYEKSKCLSADVCAALDPTFPDVMEKNNTAFMNHGIVLAKYFGSRGKSGTNDASAEFVGEVARLFNDCGIVWQTGELGKVDAGGGGTVAMFVSRMNIDTVDAGVPVLSMHSPLELTAKSDVHMAYRGFTAFYERF
ncbi:MAG: aminopeptidase [Oscillospiraceae bacterium]|nr:aminopeptidase [Oscillospiraceae bacterium]